MHLPNQALTNPGISARSRVQRSGRTVALVLVAVTSIGCRQSDNARVSVMPEEWRAVRVAGDWPEPVITRDGAMGTSTVPLDRSAWSEVRYAVPLEGVAHTPTHAKPIWLTDAQARQVGQHPTMLTALQGSERSHRLEAAEIPLAHLGAARDALFMPFQMVLQKRHRPRNVVHSPAWPFERQAGDADGPLFETLRSGPPDFSTPPAPGQTASDSPAGSSASAEQGMP